MHMWSFKNIASISKCCVTHADKAQQGVQKEKRTMRPGFLLLGAVVFLKTKTCAKGPECSSLAGYVYKQGYHILHL